MVWCHVADKRWMIAKVKEQVRKAQDGNMYTPFTIASDGETLMAGVHRCFEKRGCLLCVCACVRVWLLVCSAVRVWVLGSLPCMAVWLA